MSATEDKTIQVIEAGALVRIDKNVLDFGIVFVGEGLAPARMTFIRDAKGEITGYDVQPIEIREGVSRYFFRNMMHKEAPKKPAIVEVGKPRIIIPGDGYESN